MRKLKAMLRETPCVLVVDDDTPWCDHISRLILMARSDSTILQAKSYDQADQALSSKTSWSLVVTDVALSNNDRGGLGLSIVRRARQQQTPVIIISVSEHVEHAGSIFAKQNGAKYFGKRQLARDDRVEQEFVRHVRDVLVPPHLPPTDQSIKVFVSYAHEDKPHCDELEQHLALLTRQFAVDLWTDRRITPGTEWPASIDERLNEADLILLLVSKHFLKSRYCYEIEAMRAIQRHRVHEARVIPIILSPCDWQVSQLGGFQALPQTTLPLSSWPDRDAGWLEIAQAIRKVLTDT